jgi:tagaturonate reductase
MRNIPVIKQHYLQFGSTPRLMALGFAAFLLFMKTTKDDNGKFVAHTNGNSYTVTDDNASWFAQKWQQADIGTFVKEVLSDERFWDTDLWMLPGFSDAVTDMIYSISNNGALASVESVLSLKTAR